MKIKCLALLWAGFFSFFGGYVFPQAPVDLSWDLARFSSQTPPGRWVLLYGQLEGYRVLDRAPESYTVEVILLLARWEEDERIRSWRGIVTFRGTDFQDIFPVRVGLNRGPQVLTPGTRVLLLAQHTGWSAERQAPTFRGEQIRPLTF